MKTVIGLLITYTGFGLILFSIHESYNLQTMIYNLWHTGQWQMTTIANRAGLICIIVGSIMILINRKRLSR